MGLNSHSANIIVYTPLCTETQQNNTSSRERWDADIKRLMTDKSVLWKLSFTPLWTVSVCLHATLAFAVSCSDCQDTWVTFARQNLVFSRTTSTGGQIIPPQQEEMKEMSMMRWWMRTGAENVDDVCRVCDGARMNFNWYFSMGHNNGQN